MLWGRIHTLVDAHFAGAASAADERRLWRHIPRCGRCRDRYRRHLILEEIESDGLERARGRMARGLFAPAVERGRFMAFGFALAAAGVALLVGLRPSDDREMRARGGIGTNHDGPALAVFRVVDGRPPLRAGGILRQGDALAFSYVNPSPALGHLMVFAVDDAGKIYWFWPAWQNAAGDPAALGIASGSGSVELGEAVKHAFPRGRLTLYGLFMRQSHRVGEVEGLFAAGQPDRARLDAMADRTWVEILEVVP